MKPREVEKPLKPTWSLSEVRLGLQEGAFSSSLCALRAGAVGKGRSSVFQIGRHRRLAPWPRDEVHSGGAGTAPCRSELVHAPPWRSALSSHRDLEKGP